MQYLRAILSSTTAIVCCITNVVAADPISIGVPISLTGDAAAYGTDIRNALEFANQRFANERYHFVFDDDRCSAKDGMNAVQKLITINRVRYLLGFACSSVLLASAPLIERSGVVALTPSASSPLISQAGDSIFRTWPSDARSSELLARYLAEHHRTVGILSEETQYAQDFRQSIEVQAKAMKFRVVSENVLSGTTDLRAVLRKLRSQNVDALILNPQGEPGLILMTQQLRELQWQIPLYGNYFPGSTAFLSAVGTHADGIIFTDAPGTDEVIGADGATALAEFETRYGKPRSTAVLIVATWMAFHALDDAIQHGGDDVKGYLYRTTFSRWAKHPYSFDKNGDIQGFDLVLRTIRGGRVVPLLGG